MSDYAAFLEAQRNLQYAIDGYIEGLEQMSLLDDDAEDFAEVIA